jgi:MFS superfamily sulfate permease-like transporter
MLTRIFPFLGWFRNYKSADFRIDFISGLTVALVLIPQSMAYAQLAGLPAYYGLYAAFLPPMIAAMFGSSHQLATGPVAVVSLMTATALEPFATAGSEAFIAYAIMLALLVGLFQLCLGVLRLGLLVNFLSHPVVNGFTSAAALIIATSQLSKLFGVAVDKAEHHYETVYNTILAAFDYTHWPTLALAILAFAIMIISRRISRKIPGVLLAVIVTTLISWVAGFQHNITVSIERIESPEVRALVTRFNRACFHTEAKSDERIDLSARIMEIEQEHGSHSAGVLQLRHQLNLLSLEISELKEETATCRQKLRGYQFEAAAGGVSTVFFERGRLPADVDSDSGRWRMKVGNQRIDDDAIVMIGGGAVVGVIPQGLPGMKVPDVDISMALGLLPMAIIISFLGFMEAISIAKAMAARTGQRLDPNQELIGQGLANIVGSAGQSYAVSGSFSRSAVNIQAGARTGLSSVFSSLVVAITLIFFTPLLYHLPQAVLAAIIMMAVVGLLNIQGFIHAWKAQRYDGIIGLISFVGTLAFAPHLDRGILIGVGLSVLLYLVRNIKPQIAMLSMYTDGTYRNAERLGLQRCKHIAVIRFNGSLIFANVAYLEDKVIEQVRTMPELRYVLLVGNGINELDASGEEKLSELVDRLREGGYDIVISGLNDSVLDVMRRTLLYDKIGVDHLFRNATRALEAIHDRAHRGSDETTCPLFKVRFRGLKVASKEKAHEALKTDRKKPDRPSEGV